MTGKPLPLLMACVALSGCGSKNFVSGHPTEQSQFLFIDANVDGALATSEYGDRCRTPCNLPLLAERGGIVTITSPGYASQRHAVGSEYLVLKPPPTTVGASVFTGGRRSGVSFGLSTSFAGPRQMAVLDEGFLLVELQPLGEGESDPLQPGELTTGQRYTLDEWEDRAK